MSGENEPSSPISPSTLKQKLKSSLRLPWLRHHIHHHHHHQRIALSASTTPAPTPSPSPRDDNHNKPRLSRTSSSTWLKSPELKDKCRNLINRIGHGHGPGHRHSHNNGHGHHGHGHGRRHSADFRYDPSSYALNFDEGCDDSQLDEFPFRNFTARLPPSPTATTSREITAYT
ncbi:protein SHORT-ROOT 2-like [Durio zibethinus]|uniref:Protein SHORT-ROOT 2-like n=1 Tax=Durio zibethinus TaxID=66656 RepID=A0A6P5ZUS6_DURZI|nr:protein SHORT-ROOT 2-like [Durio zibethinus]